MYIYSPCDTQVHIPQGMLRTSCTELSASRAPQYLGGGLCPTFAMLSRFADPKIFNEAQLGFTGNLGLFLFLVHKAVHIVVPSPFNWFLLISM